MKAPLNKSKSIAQKILALADVKINGSRPWDIQIHNDAVYDRFLREGSMGSGEAYMDGWWDCQALNQFFDKFLSAHINEKVLTIKDKLWILKMTIFNSQTKKGSKKVAEKHYDLDNDLFLSFLDPYNQYSCGYFKDTKDLKKAQELKLELICKKLYLKSTDKILDIGCGWGGFAKYAASKYGCSVTGITISEEQAEYARNFTKGLPVEIIVQDYRDIEGKYDKIVSVGMIEHVGHKNYKTFMKVVHSLLKDDGLFLLHTIGAYDSKTTLEPWTNKYIFPNSQLPTMEALSKAFDQLFVMEDWHNFSEYYDPTLMAWYKKFEENWPELKNQYDERFHRMFKFWLLLSAGAFRARINQLWQIVLSKNGIRGGYEAFR